MNKSHDSILELEVSKYVFIIVKRINFVSIQVLANQKNDLSIAKAQKQW